jgi:GNAT superfamily N-acetyltransferase
MGKHLYVEDLVTSAQARSQGVGSAMMGWLITYGKAENCTVVHLDSGVQRHAAHKFYLNQGMSIACYHFVLDIARST